MTLDKVVDEIINDAKKDADKIKKEGRDEAKKILTKAKENSQNIEKSAVDDAKKVIDAMERREIASTKLQSKRIELDAKKEVVDKVFASLVERVSKLDEKTKRKIYENMIKKATSEIDVRFVYANPKDVTLLKSMGKGLEVRDENIVGGIVAENKEGNVRVDYTFDAVLEEVKEEYLKDVSGILFKK